MVRVERLLKSIYRLLIPRSVMAQPVFIKIKSWLVPHNWIYSGDYYAWKEKQDLRSF